MIPIDLSSILTREIPAGAMWVAARIMQLSHIAKNYERKTNAPSNATAEQDNPSNIDAQDGIGHKRPGDPEGEPTAAKRQRTDGELTEEQLKDIHVIYGHLNNQYARS